MGEYTILNRELILFTCEKSRRRGGGIHHFTRNSFCSRVKNQGKGVGEYTILHRELILFTCEKSQCPCVLLVFSTKFNVLVYLLFLSKSHNDVPREAQRIESILVHSWHRVCPSPGELFSLMCCCCFNSHSIKLQFS